MCKLFVLTNATNLSQVQVYKLLKAVHSTMDSEKSGFGWAAQGSDGVFGQRFVEPKTFLIDTKKLGPNSLDLMSINEHESFGSNTKIVGALMIHGRTSTNEVSLRNTHPLQNDYYALIHNGVVTNIGDEVKRKTTNDTEYILEHYTSGGIKKVASSISGYYACVAMDKISGETTVFRDSTASLYSVWIESLKAYAFATTENTLRKALKALSIKGAQIVEAKDNFHAVFDRKGKMLECSEFVPIKQSFGTLDEKSLGYSVDWDTNDIPTYREDSHNYYDENGIAITEEEYASMPGWRRGLCLKWNKAS